MAQGIVGEFFHRYPDNKMLHSNEGCTIETMVMVPCHSHREPHVRILWANDTPGPDGRCGWWVKTWAPVYADDLKRITGWLVKEDQLVRGNGPDSMFNIPRDYRHEFKLLSMQGYHDCLFYNIDPITGKPSPTFTGYLPGA